MQQPFNDRILDKLQNQICEEIMSNLVSMNLNYKFMINCAIMQKTKAHFIVGHSSILSPKDDFFLCIIWPKDKSKDNQNKNLYCILSIYGFSLK